MPVFKKQVGLQIARGMKAFLSLEAGVTRGEASESRLAQRPSGAVTPGRANGQAAPRLKQAGQRLARRLKGDGHPSIDDPSIDGIGSGPRTEGVKPENFIWIFGTGRTGSTWLRTMMGDLQNFEVWEEPMVGRLFGAFYTKAQSGQLGSASFIMGGPTRKGWINSIRNFVIDGARYAHPEMAPDDYLVIKEPNGSIGAPLLLEALPESRLILLVRDPRDVAASALDAGKKDSWLFARKEGGWKEELQAEKNPDAFVRGKANKYLEFVGNSKEAYDAHEGPKALVRYEELVADTLGTMRRLFSELGLPVEEGELSAVVEKHSWENIPQEKKGEGKFYRKGEPGSWREDLTPKQAQIVERVTEPLLKEFYPE